MVTAHSIYVHWLLGKMIEAVRSMIVCGCGLYAVCIVSPSNREGGRKREKEREREREGELLTLRDWLQ